MNPSTDDIYEAIMATPAKNVLVLPNIKTSFLPQTQTIPMVKDRNVTHCSDKNNSAGYDGNAQL